MRPLLSSAPGIARPGVRRRWDIVRCFPTASASAGADADVDGFKRELRYPHVAEIVETHRRDRLGTLVPC